MGIHPSFPEIATLKQGKFMTVETKVNLIVMNSLVIYKYIGKPTHLTYTNDLFYQIVCHE